MPLAIDEPLTGHQAGLQSVSGFFAIDPACLGEAASQGGGSAYRFRQRTGAVGQRSRVCDHPEIDPEAGRGRASDLRNGRGKLVLEDGADRRLKTGGDAHRRKNWLSPGGVRRRGEQGLQRLGF